MVNLDLPILNRVKNILTKTEKIDTDVTSVLTKLAEQGVDIDSIVKNIGTSGDKASAATIFGKLAGIASQSGGTVKSVQIIKYPNNLSAAEVTDPQFGLAKEATISPTDITKTFVFASAKTPLTNNTYNYESISAYQLNSNKIRVSQNISHGAFNYILSAIVYVVEFY